MKSKNSIPSYQKYTLALTFAGTIPFWLLLLLPKKLLFLPIIQAALLMYAALIVSFLGGAIWTLGWQKRCRYVLLSAVMLSILAWLILLTTLFFGQVILAWLGLAGLLLLVWLLDYQLYRRDVIEKWYLNIRTWASCLVVLLIITLIVRWVWTI